LILGLDFGDRFVRAVIISDDGNLEEVSKGPGLPLAFYHGKISAYGEEACKRISKDPSNGIALIRKSIFVEGISFEHSFGGRHFSNERILKSVIENVAKDILGSIEGEIEMIVVGSIFDDAMANSRLADAVASGFGVPDKKVSVVNEAVLLASVADADTKAGIVVCEIDYGMSAVSSVRAKKGGYSLGKALAIGPIAGLDYDRALAREVYRKLDIQADPIDDPALMEAIGKAHPSSSGGLTKVGYNGRAFQISGKESEQSCKHVLEYIQLLLDSVVDKDISKCEELVFAGDYAFIGSRLECKGLKPRLITDPYGIAKAAAMHVYVPKKGAKGGRSNPAIPGPATGAEGGSGRGPKEPAKRTYGITAITEHGSITVSPSPQVAEGTVVRFSAKADPQYVPGSISVVTADNKSIAVKDGSFTMPASDVTIRATFDRLYAITGVISNGSISFRPPSPVVAGTRVTVSVSPSPKYRLSELSVSDSDRRSIAISSNSFVMPASDVVVTAEMEIVVSP